MRTMRAERVEADRNGSQRAQRRAAKDGGFSLVEVVITITLISLVIIPIIQATMVSVKASSTARLIAELDTTLQNAADRVNRAPARCDYEQYLRAALTAKGWNPDNVSATYEHYAPGAELQVVDGPTGTWVPGACDGNVRTARLIQKVTITVTTDQDSIQRTIVVVKSDV